jgi:protein Mpv17
MSLSDVNEFYQQYPLQSAILTCGVKASVADGIAQLRSRIANLKDSSEVNEIFNLEFRRNLAYIIYGGIFVGAACHFEYDCIFPVLFGNEHSLQTIIKEVAFDNFVSAPLFWLPPAYLIKALVYEKGLDEGLQNYVNDIKSNGLLQKYLSIWLPAQSISFSVVPDHLRVAFMASISFFWFILFSTVSSNKDSTSSSTD